jgi:hypothetical protein
VPIDDLRHYRSRLGQPVLPSRVLLTGTSLLFAVEDDQGEDPARVVLIDHRGGPKKAGAGLLGRFQLLDESPEITLPAGLQASRDELRPHAAPLGSWSDADANRVDGDGPGAS